MRRWIGYPATNSAAGDPGSRHVHQALVPSMEEIPSSILRNSATSLKRFSDTLWKNHDLEVSLISLPSKVDGETNGNSMEPIADERPVSSQGTETTLSDYILSGIYAPHQRTIK